MADTLTPAMPAGIRRVVHELRLSMAVFREYGYQHQDKADAATETRIKLDRERKARRNFERAAACEAALADFDAARTMDDAPDARPDVERVQGAIDMALHDWQKGTHSSADLIERAAAAAIAALSRQPMREVEAMRERCAKLAEQIGQCANADGSDPQAERLAEDIAAEIMALAPKERSE